MARCSKKFRKSRKSDARAEPWNSEAPLGKKVKSRKQVIGIGLSQARKGRRQGSAQEEL